MLLLPLTDQSWGDPAFSRLKLWDAQKVGILLVSFVFNQNDQKCPSCQSFESTQNVTGYGSLVGMVVPYTYTGYHHDTRHRHDRNSAPRASEEE